MPYDLQIFDLGVLNAGQDLSTAQFLPVKVTNSSGDAVVSKIATSGEACEGILQNNPPSGQAAAVRVLGVSQATIVEGVSVGAKLMAVPTGLGNATTGKFIVAIALQQGVAGDLISVLMLQLGLSA